MRILALETDIEKMQAKFAAPGETHLLSVFYHPFKLIVITIRQILLLIVVIVAAVVMIETTQLPIGPIITITTVVALIAVPWPAVRAYIDWKYDFLYVSSDRIILVDQSTVIRQTITQMNMENVASVASQTQYMNLLPFGIVRFQLKEGTGQEMRLRFIPAADQVALTISDAVTTFQRKQGQRPL